MKKIIDARVGEQVTYAKKRNAAEARIEFKDAIEKGLIIPFDCEDTWPVECQMHSEAVIVTENMDGSITAAESYVCASCNDDVAVGYSHGVFLQEEGVRALYVIYHAVERLSPEFVEQTTDWINRQLNLDKADLFDLCRANFWPIEKAPGLYGWNMTEAEKAEYIEGYKSDVKANRIELKAAVAV